MIIRILMIGLIVFLTSCARIIYVGEDGKISYWRLGNQKIENLVLGKTSNGELNVSFDNQEGSAGDLSEAIKNLSEVAKKIAIP